MGGWLGGWVARRNGNNAKLSPELKLKLKLKLCWAELGKKAKKIWLIWGYDQLIFSLLLFSFP